MVWSPTGDDPRFSTAQFGGSLVDPNLPLPTSGVPAETAPWTDLGPQTGGGLDGGGSMSMPGIYAFDDGGVIPNDSDGMEDQSGTLDPFALIQKAVQDFRQKIGGQPRRFYGADNDNDVEGEQAFAEGGPVEESPDDGQGVVGPGPKPIDPRETTKYLAGDGAIQPAVALALEKMTDPQGQMDPGSRMMATAQMLAQKDPVAAGGYLQAKRILFNGHSGAAAAALKKGNMPMAAHHATQAFANVPNTHSVRFAPHPHGLVMAATPHGKQGGATPQEAEPQVDDDAPEQVQSAAGGGVIDTDVTNPTVIMQQQQKEAQSFEDGGETEEDVTGSVTPQRQPAGEFDAQEAPPQPQTLSTEQAAKVTGIGAWDNVVDEGWPDYLRKILGMAGQGLWSAAGALNKGLDIAEGKGGFGSNAPREKQGPPEQQGPVQPPAEQQPPQQQGGVPTGPYDGIGSRKYAGEPDPTETISATPAERVRSGLPADPEEEHVTKREEMLDRLAWKRFPWMAGDEAKREAYKHELRAHLYGNEKVVHQAQARGEAAMAGLKQRGEQDMAKEQFRQANLNMRNANSTHARLGMKQMDVAAKQFQTQFSGEFRAATSILTNNPGMTPDEALKQVRAITPKGVDPKMLLDLAHFTTNPQLYQQQGQGQPQQQSGAGQRKIVTFPSGPNAGKSMYDNGDGTYSPVMGQ